MSSHVDGHASPVYSVVFGIAEHQHAVILEREVADHPRFEIVGVAKNAVLTANLATAMRPDVVVISDLSPGTPGNQVLNEIADKSPSSMLIITSDSRQRELAQRPEVAYAVGEVDPEALRIALDSTAAHLDNPDDRAERRANSERRMRQDWTKVFSERREGPRRAG